MDLDYHVESSLAGVLFNMSAPVSSSSSSSVPVFQSSPVPFFPSSTVSSTSERLAAPEVTVSTALPASVTTTSVSGEQRLVESLEEAARVFREVARPSPPVIIINQVPPAPFPAPAWHEDPDLPAVGAAATFIFLILLVAGVWWLRKFRPAAWERVRSGGVRVLTWLALPASWLLERAAGLLRRLHSHASAGAQQEASSAHQVSETEVFIGINIYRYEIFV